MRQLRLPARQLRNGLQAGAEMQRMLDEMPVNLRIIIAREWLIFVACLVVSLVAAGAIAWHGRDVDAAAALDASIREAFVVPPQVGPHLSPLDHFSQLPYRRVSTVLLLGLYLTLSLFRSVFWAVTALRHPRGAP
jgi:hypothetical protein